MSKTVEESLDEVLLPEEGVPLLVLEICRDDRRLAAVPLLHQLEEDVGLLGLEVQVAHLVDHEQVDADQAVEKLT